MNEYPDPTQGPDDTAGVLNPPLSDPRTLTLAQPITFQLGLKLKL